MLGKQKCRILKQIRQKIADENDIPFVTRECSFQGECRGTCPRCESELRYLEKQLALRASMGKRVAVAALCASVGLGVAGCTSPFGGKTAGGLTETDLSGMIAYEPADTPEPEIEITTGEIAWPEEGKDLSKSSGGRKDPGDVLPPWWVLEQEREIELAGAVYCPETENDG